MIVQLNSIYSQYCGVPEAVRDSFLGAPSMGQYFKANITGSANKTPYHCPPQEYR
jgi:hypothetical protein